MTLVEFLRKRLDEDEWWAREASRPPLGGSTPTGEHWWWECETTDRPVAVDPALDEYLEGVDHSPVGLRSVEEYPTESVGAISHLVVRDQQEIQTTVAGHIARHDPSRVLRDVEAKRRIIKRYENAVAVAGESVVSFTRGQDDGYREACLDAIRDAAEVYADHEDYRQEWRPE